MPVAVNNATAATVARSDFFISTLLWCPLGPIHRSGGQRPGNAVCSGNRPRHFMCIHTWVRDDERNSVAELEFREDLERSVCSRQLHRRACRSVDAAGVVVVAARIGGGAVVDFSRRANALARSGGL